MEIGKPLNKHARAISGLVQDLVSADYDNTRLWGYQNVRRLRNRIENEFDLIRIRISRRQNNGFR